MFEPPDMAAVERRCAGFEGVGRVYGDSELRCGWSERTPEYSWRSLSAREVSLGSLKMRELSGGTLLERGWCAG
jgi:hypothetical protein